ncbi:ComEA family DNA-binding protein [Candidatus Microgenomates bacterium]|nr:ComEA family DNA-binding protein [Candidatus Microgenomates bacterium]
MFRERLLILWSKVRANLLATILGGAGILLILIGFFSIIISGSNSKNEIIFEPDSQATASAQIMVDIEGAVVNPGVYQLKSEARLQDGLIAAGGLSAAADRDYIAKNLNLAIKLKDGAKIYIPRDGESVSLPAQTGQKSQTIGASDGLINVNTASLSELDKLPGVGPVTGQKIIDNRPYGDVNELLSKKIVGQKVFEQIKEKITIY